MIKVSVLYPYAAGSRFDLTYYLEKHVPLTRAEAWRRTARAFD